MASGQGVPFGRDGYKGQKDIKPATHGSILAQELPPSHVEAGFAQGLFGDPECLSYRSQKNLQKFGAESRNINLVSEQPEVIKISVDRRKRASKSSTLDMRRADFRLLRELTKGGPELEDHDCKNDQLLVDPDIVQDLLLQLYPCQSMGPDGIHPRILKELADVIVKSLSMISELSWESREVPADWKLNTVAIFKKGKKEDPGNYRPVSLTSMSGKVMELSIERQQSSFTASTASKGLLLNTEEAITGVLCVVWGFTNTMKTISYGPRNLLIMINVYFSFIMLYLPYALDMSVLLMEFQMIFNVRVTVEDSFMVLLANIFQKGKEDAGNYGLVSLTLIPGKVIKELILEKTSRHMMDKILNKINHHGFIKGKEFLTNFMNFCDKMSGLLEEVKRVDSDSSFSKAFDTVFQKLLTDELMKYWLDELTVKWIINSTTYYHPLDSGI
ncbi:hypothetical protein WISP_18107 [Willisornis vidua]|uniref:Uncharacterized protein n=1 Tax=Willisornis vidua TaxID=1566151 RepID=A0ABQ9DPV6_9PASS|nr:hypothetical protein WISP_18107 [Willisornis vidua]